MYGALIICVCTVRNLFSFPVSSSVLSLVFSSDPNEDEAKYHFSLSSEKGVVKFGCVTSSEREQWVQWLTRATGQTDKPLEQKDKPGELDL